MLLEAAHIDKDAQDLSRFRVAAIVGTRPTRLVPLATLLLIHYIQNYNERAEVARTHPRVLCLQMCLYANRSAPVHRQV